MQDEYNYEGGEIVTKTHELGAFSEEKPPQIGLCLNPMPGQSDGVVTSTLGLITPPLQHKSKSASPTAR